MCYPLPGAIEQLSRGLSPGLFSSNPGTSQSLVLPCWKLGQGVLWPTWPG